jgi:hypothetical protein
MGQSIARKGQRRERKSKKKNWQKGKKSQTKEWEELC